MCSCRLASLLFCIPSPFVHLPCQTNPQFLLLHIRIDSRDVDVTYLVDVDSGLPELLVGLVEVPHTNLTEVTRVELVDVGTVVVLTTGHTATTGGLAVLADTTVTGRHMAAAARK